MRASMAEMKHWSNNIATSQMTNKNNPASQLKICLQLFTILWNLVLKLSSRMSSFPFKTIWMAIIQIDHDALLACWLHLIVYGNLLVHGTWAMPLSRTGHHGKLNFETERVSFFYRRVFVQFPTRYCMTLEHCINHSYLPFCGILWPFDSEEQKVKEYHQMADRNNWCNVPKSAVGNSMNFSMKKKETLSVSKFSLPWWPVQDRDYASTVHWLLVVLRPCSQPTSH